ncbi:MAG: hypothetical protein V3R62_05370 [Acidiferrobacterales bacterium]
MSRWRRYIPWAIIALVAVVVISQVGWLLYTGGPYRGQLVDAETRQPLEGAAVFFHWDREVYGSPGGPVSKFLKAKEVLTDKEGRFYIPWFIGISAHPFAIVRWQPSFNVMYPGYRPERGEITPRDGKAFRDPTVIPMRKMRTRKERLDYIGGLAPSSVPNEAMPNFIRLMNMERAALGLKPVRVRSGGGSE